MNNGGRSAIRNVVTRALGIAAAATTLLSLAPSAQALSLSNPATANATRQASDAMLTQVQHRGRGGGFHGGGGFRGGGHAFHGGGFRGGAPAFRGGGGGFRAAAPAFRGGGGFHRPAFVGGGFRRGPAFHGGSIRYGGPAFVRRGAYAPAYYGHRRHFHRHRHFGPRYYGYAPRYYGPSYYYGPRRFCRVIWTYYGPRKICRYRPWHHRHWHHRRYHRFNVYW